MVNLPYMELEHVRLGSDTRLWFVSTYSGKYVGVPTATWLVVFEIPRPCFIGVEIVDMPPPLWEHRAICALAKKRSPPDILFTDNVRLQNTLVSAGSTFPKPAKAYIDKALSKFSKEMTEGLRSLEEVLNDQAFQSQTVAEKNATFASWCTRYNKDSTSRGG